MTGLRTFFTCILVLFITPALAADMTHGRHCYGAAPSPILQQSVDGAYNAVASRHNHAVQVSQERSTIYSKTPLYTWASTAKLSCAKAMGYLSEGARVAEDINKCDCFYRRMQTYLRR